MTVTADPIVVTPPDATAARDVVGRARRAPVRHHRRVVAGLVLAVVGAFAVRVLLGDYTVTVPDFLRILGGEQIPGATYIVMESKLPRAVLAVLAGLAFGGEDLRTLYVTTAWKGLAAQERAEQPLAGGLFAVRLATPGLQPGEVDLESR